LDAAHVRVGQGGFGASSRLSGGTRHAKKNATDAEIIVFQDEAHIRDYQAIGATWYLQGHQKRVLTTGRHAAAILFGAVAPATGQVVIAEADQATAQTFQAFLDTVLATFPDKTIHLVLDNAKIHHAKILAPYLAAHPQLDLRFLPPYSPNLNNVERLWKWLREKVILNTYFPNLAAIQAAIGRFLEYLSTVPDEIHSRLGRLPE
jgi:transposase